MKALFLLLIIAPLSACSTLQGSGETQAQFEQRMTDQEVKDLKSVFKSDAY